MAKKVGCKRDFKKYEISGATLKDRTCKLFKTKDGSKVAICREGDKIKVFEIAEAED